MDGTAGTRSRSWTQWACTFNAMDVEDGGTCGESAQPRRAREKEESSFKGKVQAKPRDTHQLAKAKAEEKGKGIKGNVSIVANVDTKEPSAACRSRGQVATS